MHHLLQQNPAPKFLNYIEFQAKYDLETPFNQYAGLISSLSHLRRKIAHEQGARETDTINLIKSTFAGLSSAKSFYKTFIEEANNKTHKKSNKMGKGLRIDKSRTDTMGNKI